MLLLHASHPRRGLTQHHQRATIINWKARPIYNPISHLASLIAGREARIQPTAASNGPRSGRIPGTIMDLQHRDSHPQTQLEFTRYAGSAGAGEPITSHVLFVSRAVRLGPCLQADYHIYASINGYFIDLIRLVHSRRRQRRRVDHIACPICIPCSELGTMCTSRSSRLPIYVSIND